MLFNSLAFAVFLPVVLAVYYCLRLRAQNLFLLATSYLFYGWWDWRFLSLLFISTLVDYCVGRALESTEDDARRRRLMWTSVVVNLGFLGFFKYFNFFVDSAVNAANMIGVQANVPLLKVVLPVGISFYTFQSMSYALDVYLRRFKAVHDFWDFALYVSFFPQLVAGPIERITRLFPQLETTRRVDMKMVSSGLWLMALGFFKKCVLADNVSVVVDDVFGRVGTANSSEVLFAVYGFAIQIYCDFSGYSDIARGTSRLMGIDLMENFNQPYFARNITDFWRRWHISLSIWLRDYLYIPLGGNRGGKWKTYRNLMLTMLLGGLWHGANWTFVIWGGLHGLYLAIHKMIAGERVRDDPAPFSSVGHGIRSVLGVLFTFHIVCFAWIFFRARSLSEAMEVIRVLTDWRGEFTVHFGVLAAMLVAARIDFLPWVKRDHDALYNAGPWTAAKYFAIFVIMTYFFGRFSSDAFIYFQF
jgi:alginate O-acetyltransferase complex protein AlgI